MRKIRNVVKILYFLLLALPLSAEFAQKIFTLSPDPIDVVVPCGPKDRETLELCVEGIRANGLNVRRIIVVSKERMTEAAEWFSEEAYPFSKEDLALEIFRGDAEAAQEFLALPNCRIGWIYQQFLKLYAPFVIPQISPNVLVLDADVIFLNPASFLTEEGHPLFNFGDEHIPSYFAHAARLLPDLRRVFPNYSGIAHHMLFQKPILEDLFQLISGHHHIEPWRAICRAIDPKEAPVSCLSEYEIYFNFVFLRTPQAKIRRLKWCGLSSLAPIGYYKKQCYAYVACHTWLRDQRTVFSKMNELNWMTGSAHRSR